MFSRNIGRTHLEADDYLLYANKHHYSGLGLWAEQRSFTLAV